MLCTARLMCSRGDACFSSSGTPSIVTSGCGILYTAAFSRNEPMMSFSVGFSSYRACECPFAGSLTPPPTALPCRDHHLLQQYGNPVLAHAVAAQHVLDRLGLPLVQVALQARVLRNALGVLFR